MTLKRFKPIAAAGALCVALAGCGGGRASLSSAPLSTPSPLPSPSATPSPSPSPNCTAALVLEQVHALFKGQDFETHYLTIGDKFTLSLWLVDPEIDPATPQSGMAAAGRKALERGLSVSYQLVDRVPCVRDVFDQVNPMIVDGRYQHWYKDFLPVGAFVGLHDPTTDQLVAAIEAEGTALESPRARVPAPAQAPPPDSCGWSTAKAAVQTNLGTDNSAAYLIIGAGLPGFGLPVTNPGRDVGVEVQWTVPDAAHAGDPAVRERLGHIARGLACLWPAVDSLEAFVVDPAGRTIVYAIVPGAVVRSPVIPLPAASVRLYHMPVPDQP